MSIIRRRQSLFSPCAKKRQMVRFFLNLHVPYNIQVCHRYTCDAKINFLANVNSYTIECTYRYYETMSALYFVHYNICLSTYSPVLKKMQQIIRIICTGTGCTLNIVQTLLLNVTKCFVPSMILVHIVFHETRNFS